MNDRMDQALTELWAEYRNLCSAGAHHSAMVALGELENLLRHGKIPRPLDQKWRAKLDQEHIPTERLSLAATETKVDIARLRHVMSIGDEFIYEETMLLITLRVGVQLAMEFFASRGFDPEVDIHDVDDDLRRIARSGRNFNAYESARRKARKNWGLPIVSKWLDA